MKKFKALRKPSTNEYWVWNTEFERWMTCARPDLLKEEVTIEELKAIYEIPREAGDDLELIEVFVMDEAEDARIKKDFIEEHPLRLLFFGEEVKDVRKILKECSTHYILDIKENPSEASDSVQFDISCPTTSFANAYYYVGAAIGKKILSRRKS